MKNTKTRGVIVVLTMAILLSACNKAGAQTSGGKSITSATALKEYLDSQPANSADKPIKVKMAVNEKMFDDVKKAINSAGKFVSLDLSGSPLTTIPMDAFSECDNLTSVTIPNSVKSIEKGAFAGCASLTSITIPASVTSIGVYAFQYCPALTSVTIPASVTSIENSAFQHCTSLTSVTIPNSVTSIGYSAFQYCTSLTSITIPASVTSIEAYAFEYSTSLTSVTFATGSNITNENFGKDAFPEGRAGEGGNTLKTAYATGKAGTYTRAAGGNTWTKQ